MQKVKQINQTSRESQPSKKGLGRVSFVVTKWGIFRKLNITSLKNITSEELDIDACAHAQSVLWKYTSYTVNASQICHNCFKKKTRNIIEFNIRNTYLKPQSTLQFQKQHSQHRYHSRSKQPPYLVDSDAESDGDGIATFSEEIEIADN